MSIEHMNMEQALAEAKAGWEDAERALAVANRGWEDAESALAAAEKAAFDRGFQSGKQDTEMKFNRTNSRERELEREVGRQAGRQEGAADAWMLVTCYVLIVVLPTAYLNGVFWDVAVWVIGGFIVFFILFVLRGMRSAQNK